MYPLVLEILQGDLGSIRVVVHFWECENVKKQIQHTIHRYTFDKQPQVLMKAADRAARTQLRVIPRLHQHPANLQFSFNPEDAMQRKAY